MISSRPDMTEKKTMNFLLIAFIFAPLTFGIAANSMVPQVLSPCR